MENADVKNKVNLSLTDIKADDVLIKNDSMLREFFAKLVRGQFDFHDHHIYWDRVSDALRVSPNNPPVELGAFAEDHANVFTARRGDSTFIEIGDVDFEDDGYINESDFDQFIGMVRDGILANLV